MLWWKDDLGEILWEFWRLLKWFQHVWILRFVNDSCFGFRLECAGNDKNWESWVTVWSSPFGLRYRQFQTTDLCKTTGCVGRVRLNRICYWDQNGIHCMSVQPFWQVLRFMSNLASIRRKANQLNQVPLWVKYVRSRYEDSWLLSPTRIWTWKLVWELHFLSVNFVITKKTWFAWFCCRQNLTSCVTHLECSVFSAVQCTVQIGAQMLACFMVVPYWYCVHYFWVNALRCVAQ